MTDSMARKRAMQHTVQPIIEALNKLRLRREADHTKVLIANSGVCQLLVQGQKAETLFQRDIDPILWPNRLAELSARLLERGIIPVYGFDHVNRVWQCSFTGMCAIGTGPTPQFALEQAIRHSRHGDVL